MYLLLGQGASRLPTKGQLSGMYLAFQARFLILGLD